MKYIIAVLSLTITSTMSFPASAEVVKRYNDRVPYNKYENKRYDDWDKKRGKRQVQTPPPAPENNLIFDPADPDPWNNPDRSAPQPKGIPPAPGNDTRIYQDNPDYSY